MAAILQTTFLNSLYLHENVFWFELHLSFATNGPNNSKPALFLVMAGLWIGDKPLFDYWQTSLLTHISVTKIQYLTMILV